MTEDPTDVSPDPVPAAVKRTYLEILLITACVLLLELALIRWLPANVYSLAFFANQVLLATFYGFGLGNLAGRLKISLIKIWPFYLLFFLGLVVYLRDLQVDIPASSSEWIWSSFHGDQISQGSLEVRLELVLGVLFFLTAALFVPLGQQLARSMERVESLSFYNFDLLGSLVGIVVFSCLSAMGTTPLVWFLFLAAMALPILWIGVGSRGLWLGVPLLLSAVLVGYHGSSEIWSPYYSILTEKNEKSGNLKVFVNRLYHQEAIDYNHYEIPGYLVPYQFFPGGRVLVVGAGTGNDVAVALSHDAAEVHAVEIDPEIQRLGSEHPLEPYADERVTPIVQDARTYLQTTDERYDMIVFGTLDSHALLSSVSTVRLDNYVYTLQAIEAAMRCLKPTGTLAMLYSIPREEGKPLTWIRKRLAGMVVTAFGEGHVLRFAINSPFLNMVVIARPDGVFHPTERIPQPAIDKALEPMPEEDVIIPTDDWPFLYLEGRSLPEYHVRVLPAILLIGAIPILLLLPRGRKHPHWNFLLLGVGFLLMETAAITRLSLLFGSTWVVNSVVFFSILVMVLVANLVVQRVRRLPVHLVYGGLVAALLANYFISADHLLYSSFATKILASSLFAGVPIFFAGMVFSSLFRRESGAGLRYAFGSNLLGAFIGGFTEYLGLMTGFNNLLLIIVAVYGASYLLTLAAGRRG